MSLVLVEPVPEVLLPTLEGFRRLVDIASSALPSDSAPGASRACVSEEYLQARLLDTASSDLGTSFGKVAHPYEIDTRPGAIFGAPFQALREYVAARYGSEAEHGGLGLYQGESGMGWHTNLARPGVRTYFTYNRTASSRFLYFQDGDTPAIVSVTEPAGWCVKSFLIPSAGAPLWHAVFALDYRLSIGVRVAAAIQPVPILA